MYNYTCIIYYILLQSFNYKYKGKVKYLFIIFSETFSKINKSSIVYLKPK